jgi:hypothetical protein
VHCLSALKAAEEDANPLVRGYAERQADFIAVQSFITDRSLIGLPLDSSRLSVVNMVLLQMGQPKHVYTDSELMLANFRMLYRQSTSDPSVSWTINCPRADSKI